MTGGKRGLLPSRASPVLAKSKYWLGLGRRKYTKPLIYNGAGARNRTADLLITNQLLYL